MTYSGDRPGPLEGQRSGPAASELSPDDLERLATEFRPSWELDDAPFASGANFSAADVHALQAGDARHRIRQALVTTTDEGFLSGRRDRTSNHPPAPAAATVRVSSRPPPSRSAPPPAFALPPMRAPALSIESSMQARRFRRRPPWIAIGVVGAALIGLGVWATSSSDASQAGPAAVSATPAPPATPPPEPPKETQAAPPSPPPEPPATAPAEPAPAPKPLAEAHPAPILAAPVSPTPAPAHPAQAASGPAHPPASAKPATHPKAGPTIVRDVPF
jgi:hypothetical protein